MVRTLKLAPEARYGEEIGADHLVMTWLVKHAVATINRCAVGIAEFGECVWHLKPGTTGKTLSELWEY